MRNAHRPKALPNKKLPRGIERQDELIELIERRFHQEDLIRDALRKKNADETAVTAGDAPFADETAVTAGDAPFADETAVTAGEAPSADETAVTAGDAPFADETAVTAGDAPSADETAVTIRWHGKPETITDPLVWLTVFDTVREAGDVITREVADRRFHGESYWKTCDALYLSTGTYYHHVRAILHYAFACAVYHRLIDPRPKHCRPKAK